MSEEMNPITREEQLLNGQDLVPITRKEQFIKRIYDNTQNIPVPITREEWFLKKAGESGGGEVTVVPLTVTENGSYSEEGKAFSPVSVNVPLPQNAYLLKNLANLPDDEAVITDASALPIAEIKAEIKATQSGTPWQASSDETTPYNYRTAPQLGHGYNQEIDTIVGGSVAWNQIAVRVADKTQYGITSTQNNDGSISLSGEATATNTIAITRDTTYMTLKRDGRKYLIYIVGGDNYIFRINGYTNNKKGSFFFTATSGTNWSAYVQLSVTEGQEYNIPKLFVNVIDLTLALGSTIADYAYTLETSEAGSGTAWLKANGFLGKNHYPYSLGSIKSVQTSAKKVVGFNQWDEVTELGKLDTSTGQNSTSSECIRSKNYIPLLSNNAYYLRKRVSTGTMYYFFYDENNVMVGSMQNFPNSSSGGLLDIPTNARYMRFYMSSAYGTSYQNDICINIHWDGEKDGEYEPYEEHTYPLDSDLELRGIPTLVDGKIKYVGDLYASDGTVTRRYGIVDLGTLNWTRQAGDEGQYYRFKSSGISSLAKTGWANCKCARYVYNTNPMYTRDIDKVFCIYNSDIYIVDNSYTDATTFKTAMSGVYAVYELATPTTESADPYTNPQWISNWGTEEFVDTRDVPVPVGHETRYMDVYPIQGFDEVVISRTSGGESKLYTIDLGTTTIYGGILDAVKGELTVSWGYIASYNGETLTGEWLSDRDVYSAGGTPSLGAEVAYELDTTSVITLTPTAVAALLGSNTFTANSGDILSVKYFSKEA